MTTALVSSVAISRSRSEKSMALLDQRARLQAGDQEHEAFDHIDDQVPEEDALQPRRRGDQQRAVPAHVEAGGDGREHARSAEMLGYPVGKVGRHQRQHDFDARLARPAAQAQAEPADADAIGDLADTIGAKVPAAVRKGEVPVTIGRDREAIEDQRGRVVGEAFAFEDDQDAGAACRAAARSRAVRPRRAAPRSRRAGSRPPTAGRAHNAPPPPPRRS